MAKALSNKTAVVKTFKKTTIGSGKYSKLPNRKGSSKKVYRGQGR